MDKSISNNLGDLKVSKDDIIENVAENFNTRKSVAVVDNNNKIVGSINPAKIINTYLVVERIVYKHGTIQKISKGISVGVFINCFFLHFVSRLMFLKHINLSEDRQNLLKTLIKAHMYFLVKKLGIMLLTYFGDYPLY